MVVQYHREKIVLSSHPFPKVTVLTVRIFIAFFQEIIYECLVKKLSSCLFFTKNKQGTRKQELGNRSKVIKNYEVGI